MTAYDVDAKVRELLRGPPTHANLAAALREARETAIREAAAVADAFWRDGPWKQISRAVSVSDAILALLTPAETETPDAS